VISLRDLKTAIQSLLSAKGYVATIVITLGITLGVLVAMFNLNYQLLVAPLPYPNAERLFVFSPTQFKSGVLVEGRTSPYPLIIESYHQKNDLFVQKALISYTDSIERSQPESPKLNTAFTTPEYFKMTNPLMVLGRYFNTDEGLGSMVPVAVISYRAWEKYFHLDPNVLDRTLNIGENYFKIVGVMDKSFVEPELFSRGWQTDLWLPFDYDDMPLSLRKNWNTNTGSVFVLGQLHDGVSMASAEHQVSSYATQRFKQEYAALNAANDWELKIKLASFSETILGDTKKLSLQMLAGVFVLLLIASTNIINLILARVVNQQRAIAIRYALGAQLENIFFSVLTEILCLVLAASFLAVIVAFTLLELIQIVAQGFLPRLHELCINFITLVFAFGVAAMLAFIFAFIVSRQINVRRLGELLQAGGKGGGLKISERVRYSLVLTQVMLTSILLVVSVHIFLQSLRQLTQTLGYHTANQYQIELSNATLMDSTSREERRVYLDRIVELIRQSPKVELVALSSGAPVSNDQPRHRFLLPELGSNTKILAIQTLSNGSFLKMMEIPLVAGRYFTDEEERMKVNVMLVNQTLAARMSPDGNVLGKIFYREGESDAIQVIGIVKDLAIPGGREEPRFFRAQVTDGSEIDVRVKTGQVLTPAEINRIAAQIHPHLKVSYMETTNEAIARLTALQKTLVYLTAALSLLSLSLAAIGIYGVLSYSVQLRQYELGIRMAIGARPHTIYMQILCDNLAPVLAGIFVAAILAVSVWLWMQHINNPLPINIHSIILPVILLLLLTAATSLLSVWRIIRKPASFALRGN